MVSTAVLVGVIGVAGTAVGAGIQAYANLKRVDVQETERTDRRKAELYLQHKVDVLTELHQKIALLQDATSGYSTEVFDVEQMVPKFRDEKEDVMKTIDDAQKAHARAQIYLSDAESAVIARAIISATRVYERMAEVSGSSWADVDYDEEQYNEAFSHARGVLKLAIDSPAARHFNDEEVANKPIEEEIERIEQVIDKLQDQENKTDVS